jgi:hypothetical protein
LFLLASALALAILYSTTVKYVVSPKPITLAIIAILTPFSKGDKIVISNAVALKLGIAIKPNMIPIIVAVKELQIKENTND